MRLTKLLAILVLCSVALTAIANTAATENFDSYTNGNSLPSLNGGSGWSGAWANDANCNNTITTSQSNTSPNSTVAAGNSGTDRKCRRSFPDAATGEYVLGIRLSANSGINYDISVGNNSTCTDATDAFHIRFNESGNAVMFYNNFGNTQTVAAYSANTWYYLYMKWDGTNQQVSLVPAGNAASYGTAQAYNHAESVLNYICLHYSDNFSSAASVYVDSMAPVGGVAATPTPILGLVRVWWSL